MNFKAEEAVSSLEYNSLRSDLIISDASGSCGCTVPD